MSTIPVMILTLKTLAFVKWAFYECCLVSISPHPLAYHPEQVFVIFAYVADTSYFCVLYIQAVQVLLASREPLIAEMSNDLTITTDGDSLEKESQLVDPIQVSNCYWQYLLNLGYIEWTCPYKFYSLSYVHLTVNAASNQSCTSD